jgi:hypothetical protein
MKAYFRSVKSGKLGETSPSGSPEGSDFLSKERAVAVAVTMYQSAVAAQPKLCSAFARIR